jgi:hypothetical protein
MATHTNRSQSIVEKRWLAFAKGFALYSLIYLLFTMTAAPAGAHGSDRTIYLSQVAAGPYTLSAWTSPGILRAGEIHVEVLVLDAGGHPVQDSLIYITMTPLEGAGESLSTLAHPKMAGTMGFQEAAFWVDQPGDCRIEIVISDAAGQSGSAAFEVKVLDVPILVQAILYLLLLASSIVGLWILKLAAIIWLRPRIRSA